ncbi:hypothetical protein Pcinc_042585 [Petrolisthes cinctipes]|uniref:Uncharacterized protein n=1 Tax=Petrolisthes cinctipes TaxID=88211 RepID=A0AAE1EH38_PETCI|nr:hypothetical protein Pcinc_042585 [Petrolisthes cinctipes]
MHVSCATWPPTHLLLESKMVKCWHAGGRGRAKQGQAELMTTTAGAAGGVNCCASLNCVSKTTNFEPSEVLGLGSDTEGPASIIHPVHQRKRVRLGLGGSGVCVKDPASNVSRGRIGGWCCLIHGAILKISPYTTRSAMGVDGLPTYLPAWRNLTLVYFYPSHNPSPHSSLSLITPSLPLPHNQPHPISSPYSHSLSSQPNPFSLSPLNPSFSLPLPSTHPSLYYLTTPTHPSPHNSHQPPSHPIPILPFPLLSTRPSLSLSPQPIPLSTTSPHNPNPSLPLPHNQPPSHPIPTLPFPVPSTPIHPYPHYPNQPLSLPLPSTPIPSHPHTPIPSPLNPNPSLPP